MPKIYCNECGNSKVTRSKSIRFCSKICQESFDKKYKLKGKKIKSPQTIWNPETGEEMQVDGL